MTGATPPAPRRRGLSLTARLTLMFALMTSVALAVLAGVTLLALDLHFEAQTREQLHTHLQRARVLLARVDHTGALSALPEELHATFANQKDLAVRVQGAYAQPLFEQRSEAQMPAALLAKPASAPPVPLLTWHEGARVWRGSALVMPLPMPGAAPLTVAMAMDIGHQDGFVTGLRRMLIGYVLLAAAACALLGTWAVRRGLRPLDRLRAQATRIGAGQLDARLSVSDGPAELTGLVAALNAMLARLQAAIAQLTHSSSDMAQAMRAPLDGLLAQAQHALSQPRDGFTDQQRWAAQARELTLLRDTADDMLLQMQAAQGSLLPTSEALALENELRRLLDALQPLADTRNVALHLHGSANVQGDAALLRRGLDRLLAHALDHTPAGGAVDVQLTPRGRDASVCGSRAPSQPPSLGHGMALAARSLPPASAVVGMAAQELPGQCRSVQHQGVEVGSGGATGRASEVGVAVGRHAAGSGAKPGTCHDMHDGG